MNKAIGAILTIGILLVFGLYLVSEIANSETHRLNAQAHLEAERGRARAMIIEAQGQARLDAAQATSLMMMSALPLAVLAVLGLLGLAIVILVAYLASRPRIQAVERIETRIMYLPPPQASRRELWHMLVASQPTTIESGVNKNNDH